MRSLGDGSSGDEEFMTWAVQDMGSLGDEVFMRWGVQEMGQLSEVTFPLKLIMSPTTFADKYGEEEKYNILKFIQRVNVPLTITFGQLEVNSTNPAFASLDHDLIDLLGEDSAQTVRVFNDTDHHYSGKQVELAEYLLHWAQQLK